MKEVPPQIYRFGAYTLDTAAPELRKSGEPLRLTAKCLELLCFLVENRGRLITKEEILKSLWKGSESDEATLNQHIYLLRRSLGQGGSGSAFIETVPRVGYRFLAEVRETGNASDPGSPAARPSTDYLRRLGPIAPGIAVVLICAALAAAVAIYSGPSRSSSAELEEGTVTVLPFEDLRPDADERMGVGVADLVIARLAASDAIRARPTVSVLGLGSTTTGDPVKAGRELRSEMVVSGSVSRGDGSIKAAFYVARVSDGERMYSEIVEVPDGELFTVQETLAASVADKLVEFFAE